MSREKPRASVPIVAITGGIASGKTTVSDRFADLGVPVVDTDVIARDLVGPGKPLLKEIAARFGQELILSDGSLDRRAMRTRIFSDKGTRQELEALLHPAILAEAQRQLASAEGSYAIVVIPLLTEGGGHDWIDRVLVVDVPEATQLDRLMRRDNMDRAGAEAALAAQATRAARLELADDVINNDADLDSLLDSVDRQHARYLARYSKTR